MREGSAFQRRARREASKANKANKARERRRGAAERSGTEEGNQNENPLTGGWWELSKFLLSKLSELLLLVLLLLLFSSY